LKENTTLKKVDFHNCTFGKYGCNRLIEAIKFNNDIVEYDFGNLTDDSL